jgi:hypothetical protein
MNHELVEVKLLRRGFRDSLQLVLCHCLVRFVIDALDLAPILKLANNAPKNDNGAGRRIDIILWRLKRRFRQ